MTESGFASTAADASPKTFAEALDRLKHRGCLVLVVAHVGDDAKYLGCRRLLGDALLETRRRLFLTTDSDISTHPGAKATCGHMAPEDSHAITYQTTARSAASPTQTPAMSVQSESIDGSLDDLLKATRFAIARLESRADGFDSGELRICVDDLDALIAHDGDVEVVEFVRDLRELVLESNGLCHAHLSRDVPGAPIDAMIRYFDAVVQVDSSGECRQRWHIRQSGITTRWLEL